MSVVISTWTIAMKMNAWTIVGPACPTFSVPGIFSSGTMPFSFQMLVVGANDPIPRVSKKLVMKPIARDIGPGWAGSPLRRADRIQAAMNTAPTAPRARNSRVLASGTSRGY